uniref:Uncharacterized protein n=1 Tax=Vitis vinifera TaxID=29760 RepID=A5B1X3_VITVI|nr:hypothetical protein VITISV_006194 [Vitis vinifera]
MTSEASLNALAPPVFDGINYQVWAIRMEANLDANDMWESVSEEYEVPPLFDNPTMAHIKLHNERRIFTRIMTLKTTNEIWNFLKKEYEGNERVKESWSWENDKKLEFKENLEFQKDLEFQEEIDNIDDEPVRETRSLSDIYQRCNVAIIEPVGYQEATTDKKKDGCNGGGA